MKRVLVTGADGFIGRHCLGPLIGEGYEVHAVSSRPHAPQTGVRWHQADLLAPGVAEALPGVVKPSHLLHLAWYAKPGAFWTSPENFAWVSASLDLLAGFARAGGRRVVMAGTCAEYDWRYGWCSEAVTPLTPSTTYGVCKNALQQTLRAFCQDHQLSSAWGRVFFLYGPHEQPSRLVASVVEALVRGQPVMCSSGRQRRDFMHVGDVAAAFVALLNSEASGPFNVATGEPVTIADVALRIGAKLGRPDLVRLGARPDRADDPDLIIGDPARLRDELRWRPGFDLDQGLDDTIAWWRGYLLSGARQALPEGARAWPS